MGSGTGTSGPEPARTNPEIYVIAIDAVRSAAHELSRLVEEMYEE